MKQRSLQSLAIPKLGQWIALQGKRLLSPLSEIHQRDAAAADDLLSRQIEIIRSYLLSKLPPLYHDKIATELLTIRYRLIEVDLYSLDIYPRHIMGRMIETLFTKHLTCLSLTRDPLIYFASLSSKSHLLTALVDLTLVFSTHNFSEEEEEELVQDLEADIVRFLKELHNLKRLTISFYHELGDMDNILRCIAENCTSLEVLNFYPGTRVLGCPHLLDKVNNDNINIMSQLHHLRRVDLRGTEVGAAGIVTLLVSCENIEHIEPCSRDIELAVSYLAASAEHCDKRFKLQTYNNNYHTTLADMQAVITMCPFIQQVRLMPTKYNDSVNYIMALNGFQDLRELKLYDYYYYRNQLNYFLQEKECNLVHLHLDRIKQIDIYALICINQTCPNLESLSFVDCSFERVSSTQLYLSEDNLLNRPPVSNLKRLTLTKVSPCDELLFSLLSSYPKLEFIRSFEVPLKDDVMLRVLDRNPLLYLREWKTLYCDYKTVSAIKRMFKNCNNPPEIVTSPSLEEYCS